MTEKSTIYVPVEKIGIRRRVSATLAIIGNPNSGKSTLFNRLTGLRQTTGNYPGVTVEKHSGTVQLESTAIELVDLPGIYCLGGYSADERIAVDVILGRMADTHAPCGLLVVLDATHLYQGLYLLQQLMEMQVPMIVALTMTDVATASGIDISIEVLQRHLGGIQIFPVAKTTGALTRAISRSAVLLNSGQDSGTFGAGESATPSSAALSASSPRPVVVATGNIWIPPRCR